MKIPKDNIENVKQNNYSIYFLFLLIKILRQLRYEEHAGRGYDKITFN